MVSLPYTRFVACLHRIFFITAYYAVRSRQRVKYCRDRRVSMSVHWRSQGGGGGGTPEIGFIRKFLAAPLSKYIKLCMVWQPNILNNCYELSGGYAPSEPPTRGSAPGPRWGTSVPPPPNPGYASVYLNKKLCALRRTASIEILSKSCCTTVATSGTTNRNAVRALHSTDV